MDASHSSGNNATLQEMMKGDQRDEVVPLFKYSGETPLEALTRLRVQFPEYKEEKLSYAGRLDPLAEGLLIVLVGKANTRREKYLGLSKEYVFDVIFGVETDSYDLLGKVSFSQEGEAGYGEKLYKILQKYHGTTRQYYPPYSSKPVKGKPLFEWAREDRLREIELPSHDIFISSLCAVDSYSLSKETFIKSVLKKISSVKGDFRQRESKKKWQEYLGDVKKKNLSVIRFRMSCSGGTYVRRLVFDLGREEGRGATLYMLRRERVGQWKLRESDISEMC